MLEVRLYPETVECMVEVSYNMQEGCKYMQVVQHLLIIVLSSSILVVFWYASSVKLVWYILEQGFNTKRIAVIVTM